MREIAAWESTNHNGHRHGRWVARVFRSAIEFSDFGYDHEPSDEELVENHGRAMITRGRRLSAAFLD
jgi:hypothetical protein